MNLTPEEMNERSIIIGAGTYGQTYAAYLAEADIDIVGFIDDDPSLCGEEVSGIPVIGNFDSLKTSSFKKSITNVYCPIGDNIIREKYLRESKKMGYKIPSFIHASAHIAPNVQMGEANYVLAGSVIMPHTITADYLMVSVGSTIGHHVNIGKSVFISSGVRIGANLSLQKYSFIGIGATVMSNIGEIGEEALIGAGSVIIRNVEPYTTVVGNPGHVIKRTFQFLK